MNPKDSTQNTEDTTMSIISQKMLVILERLAEMFPQHSYQDRLNSYLARHSIDNTAQLEQLVRRFEHSHERGFL